METFGQETDKVFCRLLENADVFALYLDVRGRIILFNKKIENIVSEKRENILGKNWLNILFHDNNEVIKQQMFKAVIDDSITYKRPNNFEGLIIDRNNVQHLIFWNISPILNASGALDGILLIGNDTTALKEREESFKKIDGTLKNIFSSIKEYALYVTNLDGNITYYGMGSEIMFGWQKSDIIFKHVSMLHLQEDVRFKLPLILEQVNRSGQYEMEIDLLKSNGQPFPVILNVSQFLDADGKPIGYIFIAKDITERKKLEYQIFQAEKLAAIGQLAAGMGHEINNPLFVISGRVEMLFERKKLERKLREDLEVISTQAERIRKLVDRMLKFSRSVPPKLESININDVIDSVLPLLSYHKLHTSKIDIKKDLVKKIPPIKGDLNQLQEVFLNLFINAYQSMPEGGKLTIKTDNFQNLYAQIWISDTGCGIPQQNLKNMFMPFFSTKKDGTGLGLSICYNIIKNHNGSIEVESQVNKGTTFRIKLPFA